MNFNLNARMRNVRMALVMAVLFTVLLSTSNALAAGGPQIVIFGDSLVAGFGVGRSNSYPVKLQRALDKQGVKATIIGRGVSGMKTAAGLSRIDRAVPKGTKGVLIELGGNDMLRGVNPKIIERNLSAMIDKMQRRGIKVLLAGFQAIPFRGKKYARQFNPIYPRLARRKGVPLIRGFLDGVYGNRSLMLFDGLHPNSKGIDVMVRRTLPAVKQLIRSAR